MQAREERRLKVLCRCYDVVGSNVWIDNTEIRALILNITSKKSLLELDR